MEPFFPDTCMINWKSIKKSIQEHLILFLIIIIIFVYTWFCKNGAFSIGSCFIPIISFLWCYLYLLNKFYWRPLTIYNLFFSITTSYETALKIHIIKEMVSMVRIFRVLKHFERGLVTNNNLKNNRPIWYLKINSFGMLFRYDI